MNLDTILDLIYTPIGYYDKIKNKAIRWILIPVVMIAFITIVYILILPIIFFAAKELVDND